MAEIKAGVVTSAELNTGRGGIGPVGKWDLKSPASWSVIWVILSILFLFVL